MQDVAATLARWELWAPQILSAIGRLALVLVVAWVLNRAGRPLIRRLEQVLDRHHEPSEERRRRIRTLVNIVEKAASTAVWVVAGIMGLQVLGVNTAALLTAAGVGGLAIGFGAQNLVRDFISGFFILAEDQIRVGDVAMINGTTGTVQAINPRTTILRDISGTVHIFPNGAIETVSNLTREWARYVIDLAVAYREDVDRVMELLKEVGRELQEDPEYGPRMVQPMTILGVDSFGETGVTIKLMITTLPSQQWAVGRELRRRIKNRFDAEGIRFPYPHSSLHWAGDSPPMRVHLESPGSDALVHALADRVMEEVLRRMEGLTAGQPQAASGTAPGAGEVPPAGEGRS